MEKSTYLQMRAEMWNIGELEYACICVMESNGRDYYDYGFPPTRLIDEAEYVLATYYEDGHCRNEQLKEGNSEEKQECKDEIKQIRKWIKKWKSKAQGGK